MEFAVHRPTLQPLAPQLPAVDQCSGTDRTGGWMVPMSMLGIGRSYRNPDRPAFPFRDGCREH